MNYFDNLFRASSTNVQLSDRDKVHRVTDERNENLVAPVTDDEVKEAVFKSDVLPSILGYSWKRCNYVL